MNDKLFLAIMSMVQSTNRSLFCYLKVVTIGIANPEYETVSYRIEVRINGAKNNEVGPIVLENGEE